MTGMGVRRAKAAFFSGCKSQPAIAPAGSNRSSHGGDGMAEAFGITCHELVNLDFRTLRRACGQMPLWSLSTIAAPVNGTKQPRIAMTRPLVFSTRRQTLGQRITCQEGQYLARSVPIHPPHTLKQNRNGQSCIRFLVTDLNREFILQIMGGVIRGV